MAAGSSDYKQGSMPVEAQKGTFDGFMNLTTYGGGMIAVLLLYPILVFCTPLAWLPSLFVIAVFGIVLGVALKLKGGWFASVIGLCIFLGIVSIATKLIIGLVAP